MPRSKWGWLVRGGKGLAGGHSSSSSSSRREEKHHDGRPPPKPRGWPYTRSESDLDRQPPKHREISLNREQDHWFCNNFVRTSKYTHWDFLPRFLMEEFHPRRKMANLYFLVLAVLQTIPEVTNTFRVPTILLPLSIVVIVDAVFAILEDVVRHRADAKANASPTRALDLDLQRSTGKFRRVEWKDVQVGDLLLVKNRESIPADLLVIAAHEPNPDAKAGICYVETKSLDGETNLKIRQAVRSTIGRVSSPRDAAVLRGRVVMEHPNKLIDSFSGTIEVEGYGDGGAGREVIQARNLLLRGCVLRNTRWVVGLVLNTGPDTKIIMSSLEPPHKTSRLEQRTNVEVWRIVKLLCVVCLLGAIGSLVWNVTSAKDHTYLLWETGTWGDHIMLAFIQFLYLFLLLGNFIPVSLYVSMGTVKFCQAFFMKQDLDMYHEESDTPALVRTMALNEELGQVSHVFSDKTGTLTQNVMDFRKFSVGGVSYGRGVTTIGKASAEGMGEEVSPEDLEAEAVIAQQAHVPHVRFYDPRLLEDLQGSTGEAQRALLFDFFLALAVCHTVIPERGLSPGSTRRSGKRSRSRRGSTACRDGGTGSRNPSRSASWKRRRAKRGLDGSAGGGGGSGGGGGCSGVDGSGVGGGGVAGIVVIDEQKSAELLHFDDHQQEQWRQKQEGLEEGQQPNIDGCSRGDGTDDFTLEEDEYEEEEEEDLARGSAGGGGERQAEGEEREEPDEGPAKLSASSPDDEALVLGARHFGMEFRDRLDNNACVRRSGPFIRGQQQRTAPDAGAETRREQGIGTGGGGEGGWPEAAEQGARPGGDRFVDERYEVLRILDFTSARKRMSVIVRDPSGRVRILCKGADSVMIPRLASASTPNSPGTAPRMPRPHLHLDSDILNGSGGAGRGSGKTTSASPAAAGPAPAPSPSSDITITSAGARASGWGEGRPTDGARQRCLLADVVAAESALGGEGGGAGGLDGNWSTSSEDNLPEGTRSRERTLEDMEMFAREGLRTLLVTSADLDGDWFRAWDKRFEAASTDLSELEKKKKGLENAVDSLMDEVEANLRLLGCTAIEDKLQDGVGTCVQSLQGAGVKVWMLTGDKEETAINIGVACQVLGPEEQMERIIINMDPQTGCQDMEDVKDRLEDELNRISDERPTSRRKGRKGAGAGTLSKGPRPRALVIDGQALSLALEPTCTKYFAELALDCAAVVCCRVSPDQKRAVVDLVRETRPEARTLAIGDGANDVAMIQAAHIGVGISGQEGMQAVNASDFAIAQFRFLTKLMLFHGRQNYRRTSKLVVYTFYKNVLMAAPMAWYVVVNGFSGQKFYTEVGIQVYNIIFTLWPILFLGCFDRDVSLKDTENFPLLYVLGINDVFFNAKVFWSWMSQAIAEAALITFVPLVLFKGGPGDYGSEISHLMFGSTTFTLVVLLANSKILWLQYRWTWWAAMLVIASILAWFGIAYVLNLLYKGDFDFFMVYSHLLTNRTFWAVVGLCFMAVAMRDLCWKFYHRWWQPKLHHLILEVEASSGDPVTLTQAQWAEASARGAAANGGIGARVGGTGIEGNGGDGGGDSQRGSGGGGSGGSGSTSSVRRRHAYGIGSSEDTGSIGQSRRTSLTDQLLVGHDNGGSGGGGGGGVGTVGRQQTTRRSSELSESEWLEAGSLGFAGESNPFGGVEMDGRGPVFGVGVAGQRDLGGRREETTGDGGDDIRGLKGNAEGKIAAAGVAGAGDGLEKNKKGPAMILAPVNSDGVEPGSACSRRGGGGAFGGLPKEGRGAAPLYGNGSRRVCPDDDEGDAAVQQRLMGTMSSQPSTGGGGSGGEEEHEGQAGVTPATSLSRSLSWTLPLEPYIPVLPQTSDPPMLSRSRSDQLNKRSYRRMQQQQQGSFGTRFPRGLRPPSGGFAYSTDEDSASMESKMILNYVESPLKKTPAFWAAPHPVLDRLERRRESGLLPAGYGTGRWRGTASTVDIGSRQIRAATDVPGAVYGRGGGHGGAGGSNDDVFNVRAPPLKRFGSDAAAGGRDPTAAEHVSQHQQHEPLGLRRVDSAPHLNRRARGLGVVREGGGVGFRSVENDRRSSASGGANASANAQSDDKEKSEVAEWKWPGAA